MLMPFCGIICKSVLVAAEVDEGKKSLRNEHLRLTRAVLPKRSRAHSMSATDLALLEDDASILQLT